MLAQVDPSLLGLRHMPTTVKVSLCYQLSASAEKTAVDQTEGHDTARSQRGPHEAVTTTLHGRGEEIKVEDRKVEALVWM